MKKFIRQNASKAPTADINIDFGAASEQVARVLEPEIYGVQIAAASVTTRSNGNVFVHIDPVELESGAHVKLQPIWVDGPNAAAGSLVAENRHIIAQMLTLAGLETSGNVGVLIPKLAGLEFSARLAVSHDSSSGRSFNTIIATVPNDAP